MCHGLSNSCCLSPYTVDLWSQSASSLCLNPMRPTWAGATKWPKISCQTAKTLVRHTQQSSWSVWKNLLLHCFTCSCVCPLLMLLPAWVSDLRRKQRADCSPRFFLRGLHAPAAGPRPTERQGLHPSCPKGLFTACFFKKLVHVIFFPFIHPTFLSIHHYFHLVSSVPLPMWCKHLKGQRCEEAIFINERKKQIKRWKSFCFYSPDQ